MKTGEITICGMAAVKARFEHSPESIVRLFFDKETSRKIGPMCAALAAARKVYRCVEPAELEKIADSVHHGGIVAVVSAAAIPTPSVDDARAWAKRCENGVVLDHVGNAHNLGAIARTAAFLGIRRLIISGEQTAARPGAAAYRVSEGGLDAIELWRATDTPQLLSMLSAAGFDVIGAATRGGKLGSRVTKPWFLVMGNEERGLDPAAAKACTRLVTIPGSGLVESLNVSAAAAILLNDLVRGGSAT